jgi:two-component system sensor histidine kinase UhpB
MSAWHSGPLRRLQGLSLFWRVFLTNATVLLVTWSFFAFSPARVRSPLVAPLEGLMALSAFVAMVVVNLILTRRFFRPLDRLRTLMRRADPLRPGPRFPLDPTASPEVTELTRAFNEMLDRLESERRDSARRALAAQEGERHRLARELHDEIGQRLTALVLLLEYVAKTAPPELTDAVTDAREEARESLEGVRQVATRLRPEALDDLGLRSAAVTLCERIVPHAPFKLTRELDPNLPQLSPEAELVVYRVAQEALTNAIRHSRANNVRLSLRREGQGVALEVADDGRGRDEAPEGAGITGMRERALLVDADLQIGSSELGGTRVVLRVNGERP